MSNESSSFLCNNSSCCQRDPENKENILTSRPNIIYYEPGLNDPIVCEWCGSEYIELNGTILLRTTDDKSNEVVIDSTAAFKAYSQQYDTVKKYIPRLIIKGIHENDFDDSILSFSKCAIDELIIEDIDITTAYYPISFSECTIKNFSIKNTSIKRAPIKDFYSSWDIFGINIYRSVIFESFEIDGLNSDMLITDSQLSCPLNISGKSKINIALLHNDKDPEMKVETGSKVHHLYALSGISAERGKKIKSNGKPLEGLKIEELTLDPSISGLTHVENCSIKKLIFPDEGTINGELLFVNCHIQNIKNSPHCFEKDVVFKGCTFNEDVILLRANYKQSLVLEACTFNKKVRLNDLKIEKDLHLSFSHFKEKLHISLVACGGFFISHFVKASEGIQADNIKVERDINFRNVYTGKSLVIKNSDVSGNFFFKRIQTGGSLTFQWVSTTDLNLDDMLIGQNDQEEGLIMENCQLKGGCSLDWMVVFGNTNLFFFEAAGKFIINRSVFSGSYKMDYCESMLNIFMMSSFYDAYNYTNSKVKSTAYIQMNQFLSPISMNGLQSEDLFLTNNYVFDILDMPNVISADLKVSENAIFKSLDIAYATTNDLSIVENDIYLNLVISNTRSNNVFIDKNSISQGIENHDTDNRDPDEPIKIDEEFRVKNLYAKNFNINDNIVAIDFTISNAELNDMKFYDNRMENGITISGAEADDLIFENNVSLFLDISNGEYTEMSITNCGNIGRLSMNNVTARKDISVKNNHFLFDVKFLFCRIGNDFDFMENECKKEFEMHHCTLGNAINSDNGIYHGNYTMRNNVIHGNLNSEDKHFYRDFILKENLVNGNAKIEDAELYASFLVEENTVDQQFHISGLDFIDCEAKYIPDDKLSQTAQLFYIPELPLPPSLPPIFRKNKFNVVKFKKSYFSSALYFDDNVVQGNMSWGRRDSQEGYGGIIFYYPVSFTNNKIRTLELNNLLFKSALCQQNNHIEAGYTLYNTDYDTELDLSGSFVGGTFSLEKVNPRDDGHLILDNTFIDKRIRFIQTNPKSFSFINASFNNFEIPGNWKMKYGNLLNKDKKKPDSFLLRESVLRNKKAEETVLPYSLIKNYYDSVSLFDDIPRIWTKLQWEYFSKDEYIELLQTKIHGGWNFLKYRNLIDQIIENNFISLYYGLLSRREFNDLIDITRHFAVSKNEYEDEKSRELFGGLQTFFYAFYYAIKFFTYHKIFWDNKNDKEYAHVYRNAITWSMKEQYQVLRQIYGSNGQLSNEDRAFYHWMHYQNKLEMHEGSFWRRAEGWIKFFLFEKVFGWGVNLLRILASTAYMVVIFAIIYMLMFAFIPGLTVSWDSIIIQGSDIGIIRSTVFALQTTFSAVLGDWAPIGAGHIKIPMTINAVLGVLFVTFLIGAYGRKMLR